VNIKEVKGSDPFYAFMDPFYQKVGNYWPARVSLSHRALAVEDGADFIGVWIGSHDEYDRLIG
jgi:hypothetical protein